ncbi:MAG: hypothetical protein CM1200mP36_07290 [Gammaproteobacteria bacterium]|nr:MAG: hypothetical protein CM1200mP36_07290 [Gammaproteobacteria bacterium]
MVSLWGNDKPTVVALRNRRGYITESILEEQINPLKICSKRASGIRPSDDLLWLGRLYRRLTSQS